MVIRWCRILPLVMLPLALVVVHCKQQDAPPPVPTAAPASAPGRVAPPQPPNRASGCIGLGCEKQECIGLGCGQQEPKCIGMGCEENMGPTPKGN